MRARPSTPAVLATLALFFSLSGTALAAVIITKNSQVAANTIAGAKAPSGDNKNIIAGSLGTSDLHSGAVTTSKVASQAITAAKLAPSVPGALGIRVGRQDLAPGAPANTAPLLTAGPWTLTASCLEDGPSWTASVTLDATDDGPTALSIDTTPGQRFTTSTPTIVTTGVVQGTRILGVDISVVALSGASGHLGGRVTAMVDTSVNPPSCVFTFEGVGT
jgi:hypothetical protein